MHQLHRSCSIANPTRRRDRRSCALEATKESLRFDNLFNVMSFADASYCGLPMLAHHFDSNHSSIESSVQPPPSSRYP